MTKQAQRRQLAKLLNKRAPWDTNVAPASAFALEAPQSAKLLASTDPTTRPVELLARTNEPIVHWYWGRFVHDFAGMSHANSIPIDYRHQADEPLGFIDTFTVNEKGLTLGGKISSLEPGDCADTIMKRSDLGTPYQASILFDPESCLLEFVDEGFVATVNGLQLDGPLTIVRKWTLKGVAITLYGYDSGSAAKLSLLNRRGAVILNWKEPKKMSAEANPGALAAPAAAAPAPAGSPGTKPTLASAGQPTGNPGAMTAPSDPRAELAAQLDRWRNVFGAEKGAEYFTTAGLSFEQAAEQHIGLLNKRIADAEAKTADAEARIKAAGLELGEPAIATAAASQKQPQKGLQGVFRSATGN